MQEGLSLLLLSWKKEEGATSPGIQVDLEAGKVEDIDHSL